MKSLNKKIILGLVMAMVVGVSAGCATTEVTNEPVPQVQEVKPVEEVQPSEAVEENETVAETDKNDEVAATKQSYSVGETAIAKSYNMTIDALNVLESDNPFSQPDEGKEFIEVVLTIENTSDKEMNISSLLNFNAYVDGFAVDEDIFAGTESKYSSVDGTIASGKKLQGNLCYQLDENWAELEIDADLGFNSKDKVKLLFENK